MIYSIKRIAVAGHNALEYFSLHPEYRIVCWNCLKVQEYHDWNFQKCEDCGEYIYDDRL